MTGIILVLDPALLIWDRVAYTAREHEYWELADDFMTLLELLDESPQQIVLSAQLAEVIIQTFPADQLGAASGLHDFTRAVYAFLARHLESGIEYMDAALEEVIPDFRARVNFAEEVREQLSKCLAVAFNSPVQGSVVSHNLVWPYSEREINSPRHPDRPLSLCLSSTEYDHLRRTFRREYEPHNKHHPAYGYGSRLPHDITSDEIQDALDVAIELNGARCLCAKTRADGVILVFRRHHKNKYHAYPVESTEYSKYGIKPDTVPVP